MKHHSEVHAHIVSNADGSVILPNFLANALDSEEYLEAFRSYLEKVIETSITILKPLAGEHKLSHAKSDLRWNAEGWVHPSNAATTRAHVDGFFATIAVTFVGPTTIILTSNDEASAPQGFPLIMTSKDGAGKMNLPGTFHKSPLLKDKPARLFIQIHLR